MAYLIGAILVVLLIALIFIFKPPKQAQEDGSAEHGDLLEGSGEGHKDSLGFDAADAEATESETDETRGEALTFERSDDSALGETGVHDEEELDLTFEPTRGESEAEESLELELDFEENGELKVDEHTEEFDLDLAEKGEAGVGEEEISTAPGLVAELSGEPTETEREGSEEDIPLIEEVGGILDEEGEVELALGEVPHDYEQLDESEAPEELAERLDFFLGGDDEEAEIELKEPLAEETAEEADTQAHEVEEELKEADAEAETAPAESVESSEQQDLDGYEDEYVQEETEVEEQEPAEAAESLEEDISFYHEEEQVTATERDETEGGSIEEITAEESTPEDVETSEALTEEAQYDFGSDTEAAPVDMLEPEELPESEGEEEPELDEPGPLAEEIDEISPSEEIEEARAEGEPEQGQLEESASDMGFAAEAGDEEVFEEEPTEESPIAALSDEPFPPVSEDSEEEIPLIAEEDDLSASEEEIAPALGDVPEGYGQELDEDEAPEELAERLEYFLGTGDDEETVEQTDELVSEPAEESIEEELPVEMGAPAEAEEVVEEGPVAESGPDMYNSLLTRQEEKLRNELNEAVQTRDTAKIGLHSMALETLCTKQADVSQSFQIHQQMMDAIDGLLNELQQSLPGFKSEAARASLKQGDYDVVQTMLSDAANQLADNPQLAARVLYFWGRFEEERGELATAREMFDKGHSLDSENLDCVFSSGRLARIGGNFDNALSLLEQRVNTGTEKGEEGIGLARAQFELAKTLVSLDTDKDKAEQLLTSSLETVENTLGSTNHNLGPILHELAVLHDSEGRYEQAEPIYHRSLEVVEQALGNENPRLGLTLTKLAGLYEEMENQDKAESLYSRALEIRQKVLGDNHPDIGSIMSHLANILKAKGQFEKAEPMYKKSLEIAETALGKDHPNLAMVYNDMAELYNEMGNAEQAEIYEGKALAAFGMPGMGDGFVEMEKDTGHDGDEEDDQQIAGS